MNNPNLRVMFFIQDIDKHLTPILVKSDVKKILMDNLKLDDNLIINGWEDLCLNQPEDVAYLNLLLNANTVEVNGGIYKIIDRQIKANIPRALWLMVEPIE